MGLRLEDFVSSLRICKDFEDFVVVVTYLRDHGNKITSNSTLSYLPRVCESAFSKLLE